MSFLSFSSFLRLNGALSIRIAMNEILTYKVLQAAVDAGVREWVLCPGSRNSSFIEALRIEERVTTYYFPEERSAAFFALGRSRALGQPVAIVTTSGSAAGELLPAVMEAHYSGHPLMVITADRPKSFRGTGAPQSAEQVGLFTHYAATIDVGGDASCDLSHWKHRGPIHINVCLDEPQKEPPFGSRGAHMLRIEPPRASRPHHGNNERAQDLVDRFLEGVKTPIAIVSALEEAAREPVAQLLLSLKIPVMLEGVSGLREDPRLAPQRIYRTDTIFTTATAHGYPIDGVLRIGGIPTHRVWRDLEYLKDSVKVCGISENHFSGLSWSRAVACISVADFLKSYRTTKSYSLQSAAHWLSNETEHNERLLALFQEEPRAEMSLLASLSKLIPMKARIYLGTACPSGNGISQRLMTCHMLTSTPAGESMGSTDSCRHS